jgi:hypothetical protein
MSAGLILRRQTGFLGWDEQWQEDIHKHQFLRASPWHDLPAADDEQRQILARFLEIDKIARACPNGKANSMTHTESACGYAVHLRRWDHIPGQGPH